MTTTVIIDAPLSAMIIKELKERLALFNKEKVMLENQMFEVESKIMEIKDAIKVFEEPEKVSTWWDFPENKGDE